MSRITSSQIKLTAGSTTVATTVTQNTATNDAIVRPSSPLRADTRYTVTVSGASDKAGNLVIPSTWTFLTGPAPTVTSKTPAVGATKVRRAANITARFSEPVTGYATATARITRASDGAAVTATVSYSSSTRTVTVNPGSNLAANTVYRVSLSNGITGIRDIAGNPIDFTTWTFTTGTSY
nr:Ig-like domain-containing protein [Planctomonas psychrotolerans]